jgi:hypothetical protein
VRCDEILREAICATLELLFCTKGHRKLSKRVRAIALMSVVGAMGLSGCAAVSVVGAGVSVAATAVGTAVSVAGTAVSTTVKVGGAIIDAVIPDANKNGKSE